MPRIDLLVIQPTPFCNIACRYCYLPDRNSRAVVSPDTLSKLFFQIFASGWARDGLSVVWHAGEPLVLPIGFYRDSFRMIERLKPSDFPVTHSFQTNGTLINERWCEFFAEERLNLGVSIDGPKRLHDSNRLTRAGRGTFDKTIAGIRLLRRHGVPFHVISVLTAESLAVPREMFDFYVEEGIERVCFNVEESEGDHVSQCFASGEVEAAYYRFLSEFWRLSAAAPGKITFIREVEHALHQVIRPKEALFGNQLVEPFAVTSMDWAGNISTFSPELLGLKNAEYGDFLLGNINCDALVDMPKRANFRKLLKDIETGVAMCREGCEYFSVCGGGEPVNKLAENGTFASTETVYCRMTKMRATDLVLDALERLEPNSALPKKSAPASIEMQARTQACVGDDKPVDSEDGMNKNLRRLGAFAVVAAIPVGLAGLAFAQGGQPPAGAAGQAAGYGAAGAQTVEAAPSSQTAPSTELPILYVTSVEILRTSMDPKLDIVRVTGLTGSLGWSAPQLVPTFAGKPLDDILDLQFIATMPPQSQKAEGFVPIGAIFPLEPGHPFKGVRVRASENAIEVKQIPGSSQTQINVNDCRDCIGKKFVERGQAQAAQQGVVRQEDLPKVLRWIPPSRGIRGITHNPNRLNLILSGDDTIVEAFWE